MLHVSVVIDHRHAFKTLKYVRVLIGLLVTMNPLLIVLS